MLKKRREKKQESVCRPRWLAGDGEAVGRLQRTAVCIVVAFLAFIGSNSDLVDGHGREEEKRKIHKQTWPLMAFDGV